MTTEKMNVHQALAELKTIDRRITRAIAEVKYVTSNKHSNDKIGGKTIQQYKDDMKAADQKVNDLILRRNAIKRAVVMSNAVTKVTVNGEEYTVAEAIDMKNNGMVHYKNVLEHMISHRRNALENVLLNSGESLERRAENYVLSVIQAQPKDSKMTMDSDAMKALRKTYIENNTYDMIDPLDIDKRITALQDYINKFETDIDAALSVSNAITVIEVSY